VYGFGKGPSGDECFHFGQGGDGQETQAGTATLHRIQQDLAFEIGSEYVLFPGREIFVVFGITQHIYFFWTPEESQLFVSEFVELSIL
jgi:hypothetical protein